MQLISATRSKSFDTGTILELSTKVTATVVSGSFLLGLAYTLGRCASIGLLAFAYLTVSDVLNAAIFVSPAMMAQTILMLVYRVAAFDNPQEMKITTLAFEHFSREPFYLRVYSLFAYVAIGTTAFLVLPASYASTAIYFTTIVFFCAISARLFGRMQSGIISPSVGLAAAVATLFIVIGVGTFAISRGAIVGAQRHTRGPVQICTDGCQSGTVVTRMAEVTVVMWAEEGTLSFVPNAEIKRINYVKPPSIEPIVDIKPIWSSIVGWLQNVAGVVASIMNWLSSMFSRLPAIFGE